ncbi:hypothetical protein KsCSTR_41580 [Candidatus Kuenenia stuttgartiensis]|jgi:cation transport regulator ChaB|nr:MULTISPECIES: hypothetical protein [Kuenenia]MBE7547978.1 hypothetical protein [Planctomycetia bacterium]MBW7941282.1 hypothetical protein [Candidatus Kuenenia stuttgartiensis]MBZ0193172.1 hypothetical protein [Candidatus Kuenenia stuttgartiensis]MCL4727329.1 hypothetical protein [Candidatus Kuenenia stuttgartiensis]MCZ7622614.1 hypothetical protein [Candidatus Kuenenia sp.]
MKKRLRNKLEAAYKEAVNEDYELYKEWEDTLGDGLEGGKRHKDSSCN